MIYLEKRNYKNKQAQLVPARCRSYHDWKVWNWVQWTVKPKFCCLDCRLVSCTSPPPAMPQPRQVLPFPPLAPSASTDKHPSQHTRIREAVEFAFWCTVLQSRNIWALSNWITSHHRYYWLHISSFTPVLHLEGIARLTKSIKNINIDIKRK